MGLFRRGGKLLRLGGGLRDCCCRPEQPEECFCPDLCRYYWDWGGTTIFPAREYLKNSCEQGVVETTTIFEGYDSFGFLETVLNINAAVSFGANLNVLFPGAGNSIGFSRGYYVDGFVSEATQEEIFGVAYQQVYGWYYLVSGLEVICDIDSNTGKAAGFSFFAYNFIDIRISYPGLSIPYFVHLVKQHVRNQAEGVNEGVSLNVDAECQVNSELFCVNPAFGDGSSRLHLAEDLEFVFSETGITVNGALYEWEEEPFGLYGGLPIIDNRDNTDLWKVPGDFPFEATVTLKRRDSCRTAPCDCTASLSGRQVLFEGKTFNYGSLDSFYEPAPPGSSYSGTWWEENPAGTFTRRDVENCDGTLNQRVKVVEIDCINEGGVDKWVAYLDHTCNERDDAICPGPADAQRVKQWTGFFLCDENGSPTGSPTELEVDYDVTSGTPAAECVDALQPPSFEFP